MFDQTTLTPPSQLLITQTDPKTGKSQPAFPLQTKAWTKMQLVVKNALMFPTDVASFTTTYGTFEDMAEVQKAISILKAIQTTAKQYGDPQTLISDLPTFQSATTPPDSIYGHAVWLTAQTIFAAEQIQSWLKQGLTDIGQESDPQQRLDDLTELLTGQGGITSYADALSQNIATFTQKVGAFYATLNQELTGPTNSLQVYMNRSTNIVTDAQTDVAADKQLIDQLSDSISEYNKEYIAFTVAACAAPLFAFIPIIGVAFAVADGVGFGVAAAEVKKKLDAAKTALENDKALEAQKAALVTQLTSFNKSCADVETDGKAFLNALGELQAGWSLFSGQITTNLSALTADDLKDWSAFMQRLGFENALSNWQLVETKAEAFYDTGFITFSGGST